eukprot:gene7062-7124_t
MYRCQTRGIDVLVLPQFMADQSRSEESHFFWAYTIEIVNQSDKRVQLRSRHWVITDGNGATSELRGAGVVGEQPVLEPGGSFRYTSGCPLTTPSGIMRGSYHMVAEDGTEFESIYEASDSLTQLARALDILAKLVGFDTESSKSNLSLIAYVEDYLRSLQVDFVTVPNAAGDKAAIFATIGPKIDGGMVLSGHTDVVPVKGQSWTTDPFIMREADGRLYGRGTCDMKGFAALALSLIPDMQRAKLKRPIHILLSYDEETTCLGPMDVIARFGTSLPRPAGVIVGEPTMMDVADAQKSIATYHTLVTGFEAHSAKPNLGANAIPFACELVGELYKFQDELARMGDPSGRFDPAMSTISVGIINGGTARNILAKECAFQWEFRGLPDAPQRLAFDHFSGRVANILPRLRQFAPLADIVTEIEIEIPGLNPDQGSLAETTALKLAKKNSTIAVAYATEAGRFQLAGVPAVVCGPGLINQAHQPDEYIEISQMVSGLGFIQGLIVEMAT